MNRIKFHVKKGDQVEVISGNFRGSSGKILEVLPRRQRVHISNVKLIERNEKPVKEKQNKQPAKAKA